MWAFSALQAQERISALDKLPQLVRDASATAATAGPGDSLSQDAFAEVGGLCCCPQSCSSPALL